MWSFWRRWRKFCQSWKDYRTGKGRFEFEEGKFEGDFFGFCEGSEIFEEPTKAS